jgi:hypothetical protein
VHKFAVGRLGDGYLKFLPEMRPDKFVCTEKNGWGGQGVSGDYEKISGLKFNKKMVLYNKHRQSVVFWGGESWIFEDEKNFQSVLREQGVHKGSKGSVHKYKKKISIGSLGVNCTKCFVMEDLPIHSVWDNIEFNAITVHALPRAWLLNVVNSLIPGSILEMQKNCFEARDQTQDHQTGNFIQVSEGRMDTFEKFFSGSNAKILLSRMESRMFK